MQLPKNPAQWLASRARKVSPIGIKLGMDHGHFTQFELSENKLRLAAAAIAPYPIPVDELLAKPREFRHFLKQTCYQQGFSGKQVITSVASDKAKLILAHYEVQKDQSDVEALLSAIKDRLRGNLSEWLIDYLPIRQESSNASERSALVAVVNKQDTIEYLESFRRAGLHVQALEIGPIAIRRLVTMLTRKLPSHNNLILNFGSRASYITVLWDKRLILDREVPSSKERMLNQLSRQLDITLEHANNLLTCHGFTQTHTSATSGNNALAVDVNSAVIEILKPAFIELVSEINRALVYTASETRGGRVDQIYLVGSICSWPGADQFLQNLLSIPVQILNPFSQFKSSKELTALSNLDRYGGLSIAAGHALVGMENYEPL